MKNKKREITINDYVLYTDVSLFKDEEGRVMLGSIIASGKRLENLLDSRDEVMSDLRNGKTSFYLLKDFDKAEAEGSVFNSVKKKITSCFYMKSVLKNLLYINDKVSLLRKKIKEDYKKDKEVEMFFCKYVLFLIGICAIFNKQEKGVFNVLTAEFDEELVPFKKEVESFYSKVLKK